VHAHSVGSDADFAAYGGSFLSEERLKFRRFAKERISDRLVKDIKHHILFDGALHAVDLYIWPTQVVRECPATNSIEEITGYIRGIKNTGIRYTDEMGDVRLATVDGENVARTVEEFWDDIFYGYYSNLYLRLAEYC